MVDLDPTLLHACAAYLAHADAYRFAAGNSEHHALRPAAASVLTRHGIIRRGPAQCDDLTEAHLRAITVYATERARVDVRDVAAAIIDAPPLLLQWWCERLSSEVVR